VTITYKIGTTGDIPATEVLIKDRDGRKHLKLTGEHNENMIG
jgi:hypothetical protein